MAGEAEYLTAVGIQDRGHSDQFGGRRKVNLLHQRSHYFSTHYETAGRFLSTSKYRRDVVAEMFDRWVDCQCGSRLEGWAPYGEIQSFSCQEVNKREWESPVK